MVSEFFLNVIFGVLDGVFSLLPEIEWTVNTSAWSYVKDILDMVAYLLPLGTVNAIITLILAITFLRIALSFIRTVWEAIPFI